MSKIKLINIDGTYADSHKNWYVLYGIRHDGVHDIIEIFNGNEYELDYVLCAAEDKLGGELGDHDYNFSIAGYDSFEDIAMEHKSMPRKDKNTLKKRIVQCGETDPVIWEIIEGYVDGKYNQGAMYEKIILHYGGPQSWNKKCADILVWEVSDWEKEKEKV